MVREQRESTEDLAMGPKSLDTVEPRIVNV